MLRNYKGYPLHTDNKLPLSRTWNQMHTMKSVQEDRGDREAERYFNILSETQQKQIKALAMYITVKGYEVVRAKINRGIVAHG
jgi:hypothetical protein